MSTVTPTRPGFDLPPTAGLPLTFGDLLPGGSSTRAAGQGAGSLEDGLASALGLPGVQITCSGTAALVIALTALKRMGARPDGVGHAELAAGCSAERPAVSTNANHANAAHTNAAHTNAAHQDSERLVVIVPAYTCPLVALAVAHCGLELRVCDLLPDSLNMDPGMLSRLCDGNTLAVIPTHLAGRIVDVPTACRHAHAAGAWVIEDAAQALGARVAGQSVGLQGDVAFFSLAVGKGLTMFEGGVLFTRHTHLREALRNAATTVVPPSMGWELRRSVELLAYAALYRPAGLRLAYGRPLRRDLARGDWIAAAGDDFDLAIPLHRPGAWRQSVAHRALARLPAFLVDTAQGAARWCAMLRQIPGVTILDDAAGQGVWPVVLVLLPDGAVRDVVLKRLWGSGYGLSLPFVHTLPDYAYLRDVVSAAGADDLPNARRLAGRLLAIGNSRWVTDGDREVVCGVLKDCLT